MNFLDYKYYVIGCLGVGDIICSLNALDNIGRERRRRINAVVVRPDYFSRVADIYRAMNFSNVDLQFRPWPIPELAPDDFRIFQAWGMDVTWVKGWLYGWGLRECLGAEYMAKPRNSNTITKDLVGVSFTVVSKPIKNISPTNMVKTINKLIDSGKKVRYFGLDHTGNIRSAFQDRISYGDSNLYETFKQIGECESFIGADSGMAWLAVFQRIPTTILVGRGLAKLPCAFGEIPWATIEHECP